MSDFKNWCKHLMSTPAGRLTLSNILTDCKEHRLSAATFRHFIGQLSSTMRRLSATNPLIPEGLTPEGEHVSSLVRILGILH
jgi:hypothetical protein